MTRLRPKTASLAARGRVKTQEESSALCVSGDLGIIVNRFMSPRWHTVNLWSDLTDEDSTATHVPSETLCLIIHQSSNENAPPELWTLSSGHTRVLVNGIVGWIDSKHVYPV